MRKQRRMKGNYFLILMSACVLLLSSCGDDSKPGDAEKNPNSGKKNCRLSSMTFESQGTKQEMQFHYKDGVLKRVETIINGVDANRTIAFNFDDSGKLQAFLSGAVIAKYVYNDLGNVVSINGEKGMSTREYEYDDKNRVSKQIVKHSETNITTYAYEYNKQDQPTKVSLYNKEGELTETMELKFDKKKNPFKNRGIFINSMEMVLGLPVGDQDHNLVFFKKTHYKESEYTVGGRHMKPGEVEKNPIGYVYNELGYPTQMRRTRFGRPFVMDIKYEYY